jgi:o-succinylbenzoate---CoA ligase
MHPEYRHKTININNRTVAIDDIIAGNWDAKTHFELTTFTFIHEWLTGKDSFILTTSGSTGTPKPILIRRDQMTGSAKRTLHVLNITPGQTSLVCLPTHFIAGRMMLVRALTGNLKIVAVEPSANPLESLNESIDFASFVPLQFQSILESSQAFEKINSIQVVLLGGAKINPTILNTIKTVSCHVILTYGMTETISHVAFQYLNHTKFSMNYRALPGISFATDERECLIIRDSNLEGDVVTNDIVKLFSENEFQLVGRYDTIINSGGLKHVPETIELQLVTNFPDELKSITFFIGSYEEPEFGDVLALYLESGYPEKINLSLLKHFIQGLKKLERPKKIILVSSFYYTESGKIDRKKTIELTLNSAIVVDIKKIS